MTMDGTVTSVRAATTSEPGAVVASSAGVSRIARAPALWLGLLIVVSAAVRAAIALRVPSPWILPDEIVYSELAKSIADGGRPAVRGVAVFGWGEVYPALVAPAWAVFEDPVRAYHAALVLNAVIMSTAAVPAYFLARMFVPGWSSLLVATMVVLVPSMTYTGIVMTENAFYPVFLLSLLLIARSMRSPTVGNQALALLGLALVALTRIQGVALVGAYLGGVFLYALSGPRAERWGYLRRFLPTVTVALLAVLAPVVASLARGNGAFGWLGSRSSTFEGFHPHEVPQWLVFLVGDLVLYVAVVPVAATALVLGCGLRPGARESTRLFASLALPTFAAMLLSVSLVSASLDVDGTENLNERYVFYIVPLLFIGLAVWIRESRPRPRPWAWIVLGLCCLLPALLPIGRLAYSANFQSLALLPWLNTRASADVVSVLVLGFTLACGVLWVTCRRDRVGYLWLVTGVWMVMIGVMAVTSQANSASNSATAFDGRASDWVENAIPDGAGVAVLWEQGEEDRALPAEFWLMVTEFFNPSVGSVYRIGPRTYYEEFLPTVPIKIGPNGALVDAGGSRVDSRFALVTCRTPVVGTVVARAPRGRLELVEAEQPLRLRRSGRCRRPV